VQSTITDETGAIHKALIERIGEQKHRIWFKDSTRYFVRDGYLKVEVANPFIANWIERHFVNDLKEAVKVATGICAKVTFAIDPLLSGHQRNSEFGHKTQDIRSKANDKGRGNKSKSQRRQLKLDLNTFVVGRSNELAYNAARAVVREEKSPFNPLFIHGGYGVGKTHLLQGICNEVCKTRPKTNWLYLSAEDFANQFVLALKTRKLEAFRCRMRKTELLAIDDIHFLASKPSTQEEFLHTFNSIDLAGKQVVMVSDAHPKMIGQLSEKLVNRFVSGMLVRIESPDLKTRCRICQQYTERLKKRVPNRVIRYIAENIRSNVRELEGAIIKLTAFSSLQGNNINLDMAKEMLNEHLERCDPIVHISDIESTVSSYFGILPSKIHSSKKDRTITLARHFSMYLARQHTKMSSSEVGRFMGKNHATVLVACKKIEGLIKRNAELNWTGPSGNRVAKIKSVLGELENRICG